MYKCAFRNQIIFAIYQTLFHFLTSPILYPPASSPPTIYNYIFLINQRFIQNNIFMLNNHLIDLRSLRLHIHTIYDSRRRRRSRREGVCLNNPVPVSIRCMAKYMLFINQINANSTKNSDFLSKQSSYFVPHAAPNSHYLKFY